ncbi:hypothetical protein ACSBR2_035528 [Camellia fascicularis]
MVSLTSRLERAVKPNTLRSYLAEFIATFLFDVAVVGSAMSSTKMMPDAAKDPPVLVAVKVANAFALSVAVYAAANISGCHVNPAVTFGMVVWGRITVPMDIFLLDFTVGWVFYAAQDSRRCQLGAIGPLAIGFIIGANVRAFGPFTGGSMNPAYTFRSALVGGNFKNHVVYWDRSSIGTALAAKTSLKHHCRRRPATFTIPHLAGILYVMWSSRFKYPAKQME